eukprot:CAMPEP_0206460234 /NCGR_PEP_ID=MMETSP0324_2-20121206/24642_1 /ASSEMBLY_ACC=CAM_ASM_000836 /TAXON_ID=2866 /ORGANISM="Crypthecodinium cohnii, Strain Seligo" /LENGTH=771 /DNA_ID=CAMNT_0053931921 /DNA_START=268 /DNA_END=2583 /DNA_ORIENTATION=+
MYVKQKSIGRAGDFKGFVHKLAMNDTFIVTCDDTPRAIQVFNIFDGDLVATLEGHAEKVTALAVNSHFVISGGDDCKVLLWYSTPDGYSVKATLEGHKATVWAIAAGPSFVAASAEDGTTRIWPYSGGPAHQVLKGHSKTIFALDIQKHRLATCSADNTAIVWSNAKMAAGEEGIGQWSQAFTLAHDKPVLSVAFGDGKIATGCQDYAARVWSLEDGALMIQLGRSQTSKSGLKLLGWNQDILLSKAPNSMVHIWDCKGLKKPGPKEQPSKRLSPDDRIQIGSGSWGVFRAVYKHYMVTSPNSNSLDLWVTAPGKRKAASEGLGVSLRYLLGSFPDFVRKVCPKENPTFRDLSEIIWTGKEAIHFRGSDKELCPRDDRPGCSIVDMLNQSKEAGKATHFMSWSWNYSVAMMISALARWKLLNNVNMDETHIWICFFVNNQYRILVEKQPVSSEDLGEIFASRLRSCGRVLVLLDTYKQPMYIQRVWCVFETYQATKNGVPLEVILPQDAVDDLKVELTEGHLMEIREGLEGIQVENATAWSKEDEENIKREIRTTIGYEQVNDKVQDFLRDWIVTAFGELMNVNGESSPDGVLSSSVRNKSPTKSPTKSPNPSKTSNNLQPPSMAPTDEDCASGVDREMEELLTELQTVKQTLKARDEEVAVLTKKLQTAEETIERQSARLRELEGAAPQAVTKAYPPNEGDSTKSTTNTKERCSSSGSGSAKGGAVADGGGGAKVRVQGPLISPSATGGAGNAGGGAVSFSSSMTKLPPG